MLRFNLQSTLASLVYGALAVCLAAVTAQPVVAQSELFRLDRGTPSYRAMSHDCAFTRSGLDERRHETRYRFDLDRPSRSGGYSDYRRDDVGRARVRDDYSRERFPEFDYLRQPSNDFLGDTSDGFRRDRRDRDRYNSYDLPARRDRSEFDRSQEYPPVPTETRYRFPLDYDRRDTGNGLDLRDLLLNPRSRDDNRMDPLRGRWPGQREEAPSRETPSSDEPSADDQLTSRYADPQAVRFATTLSAGQGMSLLREIHGLIDRRHLQPASYAQRVAATVRNLQLAVSNRQFLAANRLQLSAAQAREFQSQLRNLQQSRPVRNSGDAEQFASAVMEIGQRTAGIRPGVVAYEFANGAVQSLDKYSAFEPTAARVSGAVDDVESRTAMSSLDEHVVGIGVEVRKHNVGLEIVRALRGGPAVAAGIQAGDVIMEIDGRSLRGQTMGSSVALISGSEGTPVELLIGREGKGKKRFRLVRRRFRVYSVNDVRMVDRENGVGYLKLTKFAKSSSEEMDQAMRELRSQGMKSLVVDVRGNPGGLLTTAIQVSDKFLRCGTIVSTRGRLQSDNTRETASAANTWGVPLVVLADGDSASASEIFAAAIQENGRGVVIGERTYGKGTVQTHFPLQSGMGTVRLTTARFYSPNDRPMAGSGVSPDLHLDDDSEMMARAVAAASHPRLAQMVSEHGTCRPGSQAGPGSATLTNSLLSALRD